MDTFEVLFGDLALKFVAIRTKDGDFCPIAGIATTLKDGHLATAIVAVDGVNIKIFFLVLKNNLRLGHCFSPFLFFNLAFIQDQVLRPGLGEGQVLIKTEFLFDALDLGVGLGPGLGVELLGGLPALGAPGDRPAGTLVFVGGVALVPEYDNRLALFAAVSAFHFFHSL